MNPLPSLLRASAWDAAAMRCRKAGRTAWSRGDYNEACRTQDRLIRACYGRKGDSPNAEMPFIRFAVAEQMQREGLFDLSSDYSKISALIDAVVTGDVARQAPEECRAARRGGIGTREQVTAAMPAPPLI